MLKNSMCPTIRQPVEEKENSEFKPALLLLKLSLCHILPVEKELRKDQEIMRTFVVYRLIDISIFNKDTILG